MTAAGQSGAPPRGQARPSETLGGRGSVRALIFGNTRESSLRLTMLTRAPLPFPDGRPFPALKLGLTRRVALPSPSPWAERLVWEREGRALTWGWRVLAVRAGRAGQHLADVPSLPPHGCVLHRLGEEDGDKFLYKPSVCSLFPIQRGDDDRWYVRQKGYRKEKWDLFCLDPHSTSIPAATSLREEIALARRFDDEARRLNETGQ